MDFPYNVNVMLVCNRRIDQSDPYVAEAIRYLEDHVLHQRHVTEDGVLHRGFVAGGVIQSILELEKMVDVYDARDLMEVHEQRGSYESGLHFHGHDWNAGYLRTEMGELKVEFTNLKPETF